MVGPVAAVLSREATSSSSRARARTRRRGRPPPSLKTIGVGLSVSAHLALLAGIVLTVRLLEDYLIIPRVLGHSVGLSPLLVLTAVTTVGVVFGGFAVILAVPLASILVTLIDIIVLDKNPAEEDVPSVILSAQDSE